MDIDHGNQNENELLALFFPGLLSTKCDVNSLNLWLSCDGRKMQQLLMANWRCNRHVRRLALLVFFILTLLSAFGCSHGSWCSLSLVSAFGCAYICIYTYYMCVCLLIISLGRRLTTMQSVFCFIGNVRTETGCM